MRKRTLGVALLAGVAISGGGAFTASNTLPDSTAGYDTAAVSGVTVSSTNYTLNEADDSKVTAVTFNHATSLAGKTVKMGVTNGGVAVAGATNTCVPGLTSTVCTFTTLGGIAITSFDGLALTVVD